jgi:iron complex outermembrane receptor protein
MTAGKPFRRIMLASVIGVAHMQFAMTAVAQGDQALEEVIVLSQRQPYRGDVPLKSLPQQVQVLESDLLVNLGATDLQSALDFAGGVARQNNFGGLWDAFAIRGFVGDENLPSGYLINGFSGGRGFSGTRDSANIDRIEVLKGPGSALYGRGEPGGTINIITKKPQFEQEGYMAASAGRWDIYRTEADFTSGLTENVAFRINGAYDNAESFRDEIDSERLSLTPSVLVTLGSRASVIYELEYLDQRRYFDRGIVAIDGNPKVLPVSRFLGEPGDGPMQVDALGHQLTFQYELNSDWSLLGGLGYRSSSLEGVSSEAELSGGRQLLDDDGETLVRQQRGRDYDADDLSGRVELTGTFDTGPVTHHLLVGTDAYDYELDSVQDRWRVSAGTGDTTYSVNVFNPLYGQVAPPRGTIVDQLEKQEAWGLYVQDQIDLTEQWKVLLGVRYDDFNQDIDFRLSDTTSSQSQTQTSPRAGIVFEPTQNLSFYASYAEGFRPNSGADFSGSAIDPEESKSYEVGAKFYALEDRVSGTVALFTMEKNNVITADPVNAGFSAALGEAESEGVEIDFTAQVTDTLNVMFNYAYVKAETSNDVINADWGVEVPAGSPLINVPENSANLVVVKDFAIAGLPATVGMSVNYVDERLGETIDLDYYLPEYTLVNLFASYDLTEKLRISVNLDNITDEKYYVSSYHKWWTTPGAPFSYMVSVNYRL